KVVRIGFVFSCGLKSSRSSFLTDSAKETGKDGLTRIHRQAKYRDMQDISGDMLRGHLETLILSMLDQGQAHGLEIIRRLHESGCGALRLKEGSLYPTLYRLENAGLV